MRRATLSLKTSAALLALLLPGGVPVAEEKPPSAPVSEPLQLDEVRVSARYRDERADDVPVAMNVLDGDRLDAEALHDMEAIQQVVPALLVSVPNQRYASYGIRGLGSSAYNDGLEGSVGVFLDGVYLGRAGMSVSELSDIERIEVLRGPQGTLYGKNTTAGAVNVFSRAPTFAPEGNAEITFGEHGTEQYRGTFSGSLVDGVLAGRLTAFDVSRDGLIDNRYDGHELANQQRQGLRGQLLWTPSDDFSARLIGEYGWQDEHSNVFLPSHYSQQTLQRSAYVGYRPLKVDPYTREVQQDQRNSTQTLQNAVTLQLDKQLGNGATLTSISGYRDWRYNTDLDGDGGGLDIAKVGAELDHHQFSQELRLSDSFGESLDYVVGAYYLKQHLNRQIDVGFGRDAAAFFLGDRPEVKQLGIRPWMIPTSLLAGARQAFDGEQTSTSQALFGQFTWHATPRLDITPGLRYSREQKRGWLSRSVSGLAPLGNDPVSQLGGAQLRQTTLGGAYYRHDEIDEHNVSGQLAASYRFTDEVLGYASASRGYKAGGINLEVIQPGAQPTFDAERATAYEMGVKRSFWNERASLDLAVYQTDVDNYQALSNSAPVDEFAPPIRNNLINVGKVRLRGVELNGALRATEGLDLRLGVAFSDARYRDFPNAPCSPGSSQLVCDRGGERLFNAPRWSASAGLDYHRPWLPGWQHYIGLDYSFRSSYQGTLEGGPGSEMPARAITNLRLGVRENDSSWAAELWVRNLFDERYLTAVYAQLGAGDYGVLVGDPRSLGVTLRTRY
ncbi:MAG: TonB-dependent receptor [Pseudomonas sp.]|uniref:TonB-dependent receptor n=1 Tax=Pseudomonas sp. TaxID=306 RepID=UPI0030F3089A